MDCPPAQAHNCKNKVCLGRMNIDRLDHNADSVNEAHKQESRNNPEETQQNAVSSFFCI